MKNLRGGAYCLEKIFGKKIIGMFVGHSLLVGQSKLTPPAIIPKFRPWFDKKLKRSLIFSLAIDIPVTKLLKDLMETKTRKRRVLHQSFKFTFMLET